MPVDLTQNHSWTQTVLRAWPCCALGGVYKGQALGSEVLEFSILLRTWFVKIDLAINNVFVSNNCQEHVSNEEMVLYWKHKTEKLTSKSQQKLMLSFVLDLLKESRNWANEC